MCWTMKDGLSLGVCKVRALSFDGFCFRDSGSQFLGHLCFFVFALAVQNSNMESAAQCIQWTPKSWNIRTLTFSAP